MADLQRQGISVNNENDPSPQNIPVTEDIPLTQPEEENSLISEGNILPRRSNTLHSTNDDFKNNSREEVMNMTKLDFLNLISCWLSKRDTNTRNEWVSETSNGF